MLMDGLRDREASLLKLIRRAIWENPRSPYLALLRWAGVEWGDLERMFVADGTDSALDKLHAAGVYIALDEFKGKRPIRRGTFELPVHHEDFDNPLLKGHFEGQTGGSGGVRRRLLIDLDLIEHDAAAHSVFLESFGLSDRPAGIWRAVPPTNSGIKKPLMAAKIGRRIDRWFSPSPVPWSPAEFKYTAFLLYTVAAARLSGRHFAYPEYVPKERVEVIARWLAEMVAAGTPAAFDSAASAAVRICTAAQELGLDISGSFFRTGSEPLTSVRAEIVKATGARVACHYSSSETGPMGMACADNRHPDELHILLSKMAVLQKEQAIGLGGANVGMLYLTTISTASPKLMLNVDTGDSGLLERRKCGCLFGEIGFHLHLRQIRSHEKLTSEGIRLTGDDLLRLVEEILPKAFGGGPNDYQLVEDDFQGLPRVQVLVHPRLGAIDEAAVTNTVLAAINATGPGRAAMVEQLQHTRTFSVLRREPYLTPAYKTMPLHVMARE